MEVVFAVAVAVAAFGGVVWYVRKRNAEKKANPAYGSGGAGGKDRHNSVQK